MSARKTLDSLRREIDEIDDALHDLIVRRTKAAFEVTPEVVVLETGTLAREFESSIKAPRFVDRRE